MFFAESNLDQVKEVTADQVSRNLCRAETYLKVEASKGRVKETNLMEMACGLETRR
jgi:hypothetical protein